jgi:acetyl esterase/lipase
MTASVDVRALLDPEVAAALAAFPLALGSLSAEALPMIREAFRNLPPVPLSDAVQRTDHDVASRSGVSVRVHRAKSVAGTLPCIYWMHGGGLILGTNKADDARFDRWCQRLNCVGVSVEYALAPESRYPGPLEDCYAGLRWVRDNAAALGVDVNRIGVAGASAGAGLAAGLALLARDRREIALSFQALIYPMIDDRMITPSSAWEDPVWPPGANRFGWSSYLGDVSGDAVPYYAAAARATDLTKLPRTFISVGALDGFSDEDIDYAVRMRHAGVPTELHVYPGAPHGFDGLAPDTAIAKRANRDIEEWLAAAMR